MSKLIMSIGSENRGESDTLQRVNQTQRAQGVKFLREIRPLGMRVLVQIKKDDNKTNTGLYLPEGAKQAKQESLLGEVIEVAMALHEDDDELSNISGIPLGALVLIPSDAGVKIPWNDNLRIVETLDVLALVEEHDAI